MIESIFIGAKARKDYELVVHWMVDNGDNLYYMYWPIELGRYVLESGWVTAIHGMEFISKGCVKISDICGEMNPLVFSALEEVNLVFILMMSSTVMVDIVFARFMFCTFYWR